MNLKMVLVSPSSFWSSHISALRLVTEKPAVEGGFFPNDFALLLVSHDDYIESNGGTVVNEELVRM